MRWVRRSVRWIGLGFLLFAALLLLTVFSIPRISWLNNSVRTHLVEYINAAYEGKIAVHRLHISFLGPISLYDVSLSYHGQQVASIAQVRIGYELLPLIQKRIILSSLDVIQPIMHLAREPDGQWNLVAALRPRTVSTSKSSFGVDLKAIGIRQGDVNVETAPSAAYRLTQIDAAASAEMNQPKLQFNLSSVAFAVAGPKIPVGTHVRAGLAYDQAKLTTIKISALQIWTNQSHILVNGAIDDLAAKAVSATINLKQLSAPDIDTAIPSANVASNVSGIIRISGQASAIQSDLALNSGPARINASVNADIGQPKPPWHVDAKLTGLDLHKLLKPQISAQLPSGQIDATVKASAIGNALPTVNGKVNAQVAGLSMRAMKFGNLSLVAEFSKQVANLNANLSGTNGAGRLTGKIDISHTPAYQLTCALAHLQPARLTGSASIPPADLNLTADINGAGYRPSSMRTQARIKWQRSTLGRVTIDSGLIDARVADGLARIATFSFRAGQTTLDAGGIVGLTASHQTNLNYKLAVGQLSPWLQMAGQKGSGQLQVAGQASGTLTQLRTNGDARLQQLRLDKYSVAQGHLTYNLGGLGKSMKPDGQIALAIASLHAGVDLKTLNTRVRLTSGAVENAEITADALDRFSHPASLRTNIALHPGEIVADLSQLSIATYHGTWNLRQPAQFTKKADRIEITNLAAYNGGQIISLQGVVAQRGTQAVTANIQSLRISDFASYFPKGANVSGLLSAQLSVRGSAAEPIISLSSDINRLDVNRITYAGVSARLDYQQGHAQAQATITQDARHTLDLSATLPFQLSWSQGFQSKIAGDLDARAVSPGINLAFLNSLAIQKITGIGGNLALNITARGPLTHPAPSGFIRLIDARASVPSLDVNVTDAGAMVELSPQQIRLVSLSAKAGEGTLTGGGLVTMAPDGRPQGLNLYAVASKWPAIKTHEYNATSDARITLTGTMQAPVIDGRAEVLYGVLRPNLSITGSKPHLDRTIVVVRQWRPVSAQTPPPPPPPPPAVAPLPANLALNFRLIIDRNTWIKTADFAVELQGNLHLVKQRDQQLAIAGEIDTVRGTVVVAQRQFDLKRGQILFTGGHEINPELDLVAQMQVPSYLISVNITGSAEKPKLTLNSIPDLPQSDILSVMMFGKPTNQLSGNQQQDLQNQAVSMAGGYAAAQVGQAVSQALGLSELGVTTTSSGVGLGRYLTKNIYVSANQSSSNMQDRRAQIQYYVTPDVTLDSSASTNYGNEIKLQWHKEY